MARITSFKNGSKRKHSSTEYCKDIYLNLNGIDTKVGVIGKTGWGEFLEYRVYYFKSDFGVASRSQMLVDHTNKHNLRVQPLTNKSDESVVLMQTYDNLKEAVGYAKRVFKDTKALKTEMFNVYLKLLQALG